MQSPDKDGSTAGDSPCLSPAPWPAQRFPILWASSQEVAAAGAGAVPLCRAVWAGTLGSPGAGHSHPAGPHSSEVTETGAASSAAKRRGKKRSGHRSEGRRKSPGATAPWLMCQHIHHPAFDPKMGQKKYRAGRVRVRISLLLMAVGQVPGCVQPCGGRGCPHIQPRDLQAGWGSEDRREFPSQGQLHWSQTHRSCRGIPASHSTNSALR